MSFDSGPNCVKRRAFQSDVFVDVERRRYGTENGNRFAFSLGQAIRYVEFLGIIESRYAAIGTQIHAANKRFMQRQQEGGVHQLTSQEYAEFVESQNQHIVAHLEIESFYLFSKILIDKLAHFVEDYFGKAHGISMRSHGKWVKGFERYCAVKNIKAPEGMSERMSRLEIEVAEFRDKRITHLQNPRAIRGTSTNDGNPSMAFAILYPKESELRTSSESSSVPTSSELLAAYIQDAMVLIEDNRAHSRFLSTK